MGVISDKWNEMRQQVIDTFDLFYTGMPLEMTDDVSIEDVYNSLSIEGYKVDRTLTNNVLSGQRDVESDDEKTVLIIKGYYQAFQKVNDSIVRIRTEHLNPGQCVESEFMDWYIDMWRPFIDAGIIKLSDIMGYRNRPVYIKNSWHVPPASHKLIDYMDEYFECLKNEEYASVRAVLGHFFLTWIHPFNDGNGRMARFVMNAMLTTGGYSWTVIPVSERNRYMTALEKASVEGDITDFSKLIAEL
jgi:Fic family protein